MSGYRLDHLRREVHKLYLIGNGDYPGQLVFIDKVLPPENIYEALTARLLLLENLLQGLFVQDMLLPDIRNRLVRHFSTRTLLFTENI
ncbi:hypothetical protein ES703_44358 [subsurface metagenome]